MEILREIVAAFKSARTKYGIHLEEQKKKELTEAEVKAQHLSADVERIKSKCKQTQDAIEMMDMELVECMKNAELKNEFC